MPPTARTRVPTRAKTVNRMRFRPVLVGWMFALVWLSGAAQSATDRLSDEAFAALIPRLSEEGGAFPVENFVSNERTFQVVVPRLRDHVRPGGVYIGVGPEQNFTFINAVRPAVVFIIDIRRQNMLEHLMYKAAFETAATRADFLSYIFSRPRPPNLDTDTNVTALLRAYLPIEPSKPLRTSHEEAAISQLHARFPGVLTSKDDNTLKHLYSTFFEGGPLLTYAGPRPAVVDPGRRGWATMVVPSLRRHFLTAVKYLRVRMNSTTSPLPPIANGTGPAFRSANSRKSTSALVFGSLGS